MDADEQTPTHLSTVADRYRTIRAIEKCDAVSLTTLADRIEASKSTANRIANELGDLGLVDVEDRGGEHYYSLSFLGGQFAGLLEEGVNLLEQREMYEAIPPAATLPRWLVSEGTVEVAQTADPARHEVFDRIFTFISRVDRFRVVAPALTRDSTFSHLANEVIVNEMAVEMTLPESFFRMLGSRFPDRTRTLLDETDVTAQVLPDSASVPYGFGLGYVEADDTVVDAEVAVVCYDEYHHSANGTVVADSPEAVAWAEARYAEYRDRATPWSRWREDDSP